MQSLLGAQTCFEERRCCPRGLGTVGVEVSPEPPAMGRTWPWGCSAHACNGVTLGAAFAASLWSALGGSPRPSRLCSHHPALQEEHWLCAPQSDPALISFGPVTPCLSLPPAEQLVAPWGRIYKTKSDKLGETGPVCWDRDTVPCPRPLFLSPQTSNFSPCLCKNKTNAEHMGFMFFNCFHQDNGNPN